MSVCALHPYKESDGDDLHAAIQESLVEVGRWMPWCRAEYSLEEAREWAAGRAELARQGVEYDFAIRDEAGRFLGGCGLNQVNRVNRFANLGYWVRTSAMGRGVAPAAVRLLINHVFETTDLLRIEIVCAVGNERSQRVAEKVGARREGILRNRLILPTGPADAVMNSVIRPPG